MISLRKALLTSAALCLPVPAIAAASCSGTAPVFPAADGGFGVLLGQIYAPDGTPFVAHGVDVMEGNQPSAAEILAQMPGTNYVRLAIYDYASAASLQPYIDDLTAAGIVVEIEHHIGAGGGVPPLTGDALAQENAWFTSIGSAFKSNPYVWFGTLNEPLDTGSSAGLLATEMASNYSSIRSTGNNNPIALSLGSGPPPVDTSQMHNIVLDQHFYGWTSNYSPDQALVTANLNSIIANDATTSADGPVPVIIGEYGNSTDPSKGLDANGAQVIQAAQQSGLGAVAWAWGVNSNGDGLLDGNGGLSGFGKTVAAWINTSGATGCALPPISIPTVAVLPTTQATGLSVADVANLAAQGLTSSGQSIGDVAQMAATGPSSGGALATDPTTAAVLAAGAAPTVAPVVRAVASPSGTMPTPDPASNAVSFSASGDSQTVVPTPGNGTGAVSGTGNTINATGGIQTITVSGSGNTVSTGPYNDTITVQSAGNTINTGGGNDTIVLAYGGTQPSTAINADAPPLPPLASTGNIFVAPPPGTGLLTIQGTLASNDRIDLTKALAGTTWDGSRATVWNYVTAATSSTGCTISVGGHVVVTLPGGSPGGQLGSFITATGISS